MGRFQQPRLAVKRSWSQLRPAAPAAPEPPAFCPVAPAAPVRIYQIAREFDIWVNLCGSGRRAMEAIGWQVRVDRAPPHDGLACDHCEGRYP